MDKNDNKDTLSLSEVSLASGGIVLTDVESIHSDDELKHYLHPSNALLLGNNQQNPVSDQEFIECSNCNSDVDTEPELSDITTPMILDVANLELINHTVNFISASSDPRFDADIHTDRRHKNVNLRKREGHLLCVSNLENVDFENLTEADEISGSSNDEIINNVVKTTIPEFYLNDYKTFSKCESVKSESKVPATFTECRKKKRGSARHRHILERVVKSESDESADDNKKRTKGSDKKKRYRKNTSDNANMQHHLTLHYIMGSNLTENELLTDSDENSSISDCFEDEIKINPIFDKTDVEDFNVSGIDESDLMPIPVEKEIVLTMPNSSNENTKISCGMDCCDSNESAVFTDEEGFQFESHDATGSLIGAKLSTIVNVDNTIVEPEIQSESEVNTDSENVTTDDSEKEKVPEPESDVLFVLDLCPHSEIKEKLLDELNIYYPSEMSSDENLTDMEALLENEEYKVSADNNQLSIGHEGSTSSDCFEYSDDEILDSRRLAWATKTVAPPPSEIRFIETDYGSMSILITPNQLHRLNVADNIEGVIFLEDKEALTDIEELCKNNCLKVQPQKAVAYNDSETDTEDLSDSNYYELSEFMLSRMNDTFIPSSKNEQLHIIEGEDGNFQVKTIVLNDMDIQTATPESEKEASTDSESIEHFEIDASCFNCTDNHNLLTVNDMNTEINCVSKTRKRKQKQKQNQKQTAKPRTSTIKSSFFENNSCYILKSNKPVKQDECEGTDVEILGEGLVTLKCDLQVDSAFTTDVEFSSDWSNELINHTGSNDPSCHFLSSHSIIYKEGDQTITKHEFSNNKLKFEDNEENKATDTEDAEASEIEEFKETEAEHDCSLPEYEYSDVTVLEQSFPHSSKENEDKEIKENLLITSQEHLTEELNILPNNWAFKKRGEKQRVSLKRLTLQFWIVLLLHKKLKLKR